MTDYIECPKCHYEHEPSGVHDEDAGEMECDGCGFRFIVDIDYDVTYNTSCVEHEFDEWLDGQWHRTCKVCGHTEIRE